jgi:acyl dehydratase
MNAISLEKINIGDTLPALALPPINRTTLALFAGASGDHNAIHIDTDYARKAGMVDQRQLREFGVRFMGITQLGHQITCTGAVVDRFEFEGEQRIKVEVRTTNQYGETKIVGDAVIAL